MKVVVAGRKEGKSTAAVKWLLEDERRILITDSARTKQHLLNIVFRLLDPARPSTLIGFYSRRIVEVGMLERDALRGLDISEVGIDDVDTILPRLLGIPCKLTFATITGEAVGL